MSSKRNTDRSGGNSDKTPNITAAVGRPVRHESAEKHVQGRAFYIDDMPEPENALHVALCLSREIGLLEPLDMTEVKSKSGVVDAVSMGDIPGSNDIGPVFSGDKLFAENEVVFCGQTLFAVAADSYEAARKAVLDYDTRVKAGEPILDPELAVQQQKLVRPSHTMCRGNAGQALQASPRVLEGKLRVGGQEHYYLEGQIAMAIPAEDNGIHLYSSTQHPSEVQKLVAKVLDLPLGLVTIETRRMGGGFGGKETQAAQWACIAALFAYRNGRAVKLRLPRREDMLATGKRHPFVNTYKVGFDTTGRLLAADFELIGDCGCTPDLSDAIVDRAMFHSDNAYYIPDVEIMGHRAFTNKVSNTAFRGFGAPQGMLTIEKAMDDIAYSLQKDPLEVRKRNLYGGKGRNTTPYYQKVKQNILPQLIEELESSSEYWPRRKEIKAFNQSNSIFKKGLALTPVKFGVSFTVQHLNQAGALVHVYTDGSVHLNHGGTEMGQGLNTKVAQVVAEVFQIDLANVFISATRTDKVPNTSPTAASSGSDLNGQAARKAALKIKKRLINYVARRESIEPGKISFKDNRIYYGKGYQSFAELAQAAYLNRISLSATGYYKTPKIYYDRTLARGRPFFYYANGASVSEVTIDTLTGEYRVNRVDILHDVGNSLNPALDIGQIEGGFIQGMGWLTTEELSWDQKGTLLTQGASTYKIPAASDTPEIFKVSLLKAHPNKAATIYHSKAVGEPPFMLSISVWSALRDAINSVGDYSVSVDLDTPATPERVYMAVKQAQEASHAAPK